MSRLIIIYNHWLILGAIAAVLMALAAFGFGVRHGKNHPALFITAVEKEGWAGGPVGITFGYDEANGCVAAWFRTTNSWFEWMRLERK